MSQEVNAAYLFLPYLRIGASTEISNEDTLGSKSSGTSQRTKVPVTVEVNQGAISVSKDIFLYGPSDVTGFDQRVIIRTYPENLSPDSETNYHPLVEFSEPDLPWKFTPARATPDGKLRPWICLIALKSDEFHDLETDLNKSLTAISVNDAASLPDLTQAWAWAHVQISGDIPANSTIGDFLSKPSSGAISRLLCPRRLEPLTEYTTFVVPVFETGRLAGLGSDIPTTTELLQTSWSAGQKNIFLPWYYRWQFKTGAGFDFQALVSLLKPYPIPKGVGTIPIDASDPDPARNVPSAGPTLALEGALAPVGSVSSQGTDPVSGQFRNELTKLVNSPQTVLQSSPTGLLTVAPTLYGGRHSAAPTVAPGTPPVWLYELNTDPRYRTTAGFGTQIVQDQKQQLLAAAWAQVEGVIKANQVLRQAQLSQEISKRLHEKDLKSASGDTLLTLTSPVQSRVLGSETTIRQRLAESPIPTAALDPAFRRIIRPRGPIRQVQVSTGLKQTNILTRLNKREITAAPPSPPPDIVSADRVSDTFYPPWAPSWLRGLLPFAFLILFLLAILLFLGGVMLSVIGIGISSLGIFLFAAATLLTGLGVIARRKTPDWTVATGLREEKLTPAAVKAVAPRPGFRIVKEKEPLQPPVGGPGPDSEEAANFRTAAVDLQQHLLIEKVEPLPAPPIDINSLSVTLLKELDPRVTVPQRINARLVLPAWLEWEPDDPLDTIGVGPDFPQAMYDQLQQKYLFPGLELVPQNVVAVLKTNPRFVESCMVGLNEQMSRELLWNEYPTELRYTYFRQFWDVRRYVPPPGQTVNPEDLKDIPPIHTWRRRRHLGENMARASARGEQLVLLIRGDLLRRYPRPIIYAVKAKLGSDGKRDLGDDERHPIFGGNLPPDITFVGFDLTLNEAKGTEGSAQNQGWFFVIQEHTTEPRFALLAADSVTVRAVKWSELSWRHLASSDADLKKLNYIDLKSALPDTAAIASDPGEPTVSWGSNSADMAYITLHRPVRIAIHISELMKQQT